MSEALFYLRIIHFTVVNSNSWQRENRQHSMHRSKRVVVACCQLPADQNFRSIYIFISSGYTIPSLQLNRLSTPVSHKMCAKLQMQVEPASSSWVMTTSRFIEHCFAILSLAADSDNLSIPQFSNSISKILRLPHIYQRQQGALFAFYFNIHSSMQQWIEMVFGVWTLHRPSVFFFRQKTIKYAYF